MPKSRTSAPRIGKWFLKTRGAGKVWYISWYEGGQTRGITTSETDLKVAEICLARHALKNQEAEKSKDAPLADALSYYWIERGEKLASSDMFRSAMHHSLEILGDNCQISTLGPAGQKKLIDGLRARGLADSTILRHLGCLWAALALYREDEHISGFPDRISQTRWAPVLKGRDRVLSLAELAALMNKASDREHCWRFMVLAIGTASRPRAILDLTGEQIDLEHGLIHLNPEGRAQTKKRRPVVPMATTLTGWVEEWLLEAPRAPIVHYRGEVLGSDTWFDNLKKEAGVDCVPYDIRHTVITWLVRKKVHPDSREIFVGHKLPGSSTTANYVHLDPEYLRDAADAVEDLFQALGPLVTARDLCRTGVLDEQPVPPSAVEEVDQILNRLRSNV